MAYECHCGFWDDRTNIMAATMAATGSVLGPLLVAITGELSLNAGILCGLGAGGAAALAHSWLRRSWGLRC